LAKIELPPASNSLVTTAVHAAKGRARLVAMSAQQGVFGMPLAPLKIRLVPANVKVPMLGGCGRPA